MKTIPLTLFILAALVGITSPDGSRHIDNTTKKDISLLYITCDELKDQKEKLLCQSEVYNQYLIFLQDKANQISLEIEELSHN